MAPTARWSPPLPLLLLLAAATATTVTTTTAEHPPLSDSDSAAPSSPTPWPDRFHAVLFTNLTNYSAATTGPPLRMTDLYYDWPRRRNLNVVRHQLSRDPLYDVEWNNGTTFYFDSTSCRVEQFPVGVLPPWWLVSGSEYLGRRVAGGIDCHVWGKAGFVFYYEEASTGRPVRWDFTDVTEIQQFVMTFEPGVEMEDDAQCRHQHTASQTMPTTNKGRATMIPQAQGQGAEVWMLGMGLRRLPGYSGSLQELQKCFDCVLFTTM